MTYTQPMADPTAIVGRRIGAFAIDAVLMALVTLAIVVPMFLSSSKTVSNTEARCDTSSSTVGEPTFDERPIIDSAMCFETGDDIVYIPDDQTGAFSSRFYGVSIGLSLLNLVLLQGLTGGSIGKLVLGLRVVRQDGQKAGFGWIFLRWVLLFVDSFCCFLPGAILVFTTKGHRRIGDMAAGTFVVHKDQVGGPLAVPGVTSGYGTPGYASQGYPGQAWTPPPAAGPPGTFGTPSPAPSSPPEAGSGEGPTWDAARNAYIQYDRQLQAWVQWSDAAGAWLPIDQ